MSRYLLNELKPPNFSDVQFSISDIQFSTTTPNVQPSTPTPDVQSSTSDVKSSTFDVKSSTSDVKCSTSDVKSSTSDGQPSASDVVEPQFYRTNAAPQDFPTEFFYAPVPASAESFDYEGGRIYANGTGETRARYYKPQR